VEQAILVRMSERSSAGAGSAAIAREFAADGIANPRTGHARSSRQLVHGILSTSARGRGPA